MKSHTPPTNLKESAPAKAQADQTVNRNSSTKTDRLSAVKSTQKTLERVKSISDTTKPAPIDWGSISSIRQAMSATPTTSIKNKETNPGLGVKDAGRVKINRALRLVWDSLQSHLDAATGTENLPKCCFDAVGNQKFHRKCVKEYGEIIQTLTELI